MPGVRRGAGRGVAFRAEAQSLREVVGPVDRRGLLRGRHGDHVYASGVVQGRASPATAAFLDKIAGILLTAIAVTILASGSTRLVVDVLEGLGR